MKIPAILFLFSALLSAEVTVTKGADQIAVAIDGKPFTALHYGPKTFKPYLHPLLAADGTAVTRGWPVQTEGNETHDHPHHTGLWFTHGDVNGLDFWATTAKGPKNGTVVLEKIVDAKSGKTGLINAVFHWIDNDNKTILEEQQRITFSGDKASRTIEFDSTLKAAVPVKFGDTKEGTFAVRLSDALREKGGSGTMTSAEGATKMAAIWGKPSPWVDYAGTVDGKPVGVAIFDHPGNPRHPTTWHARDYGLFAANIFGQRDFTGDKTKDGSLQLSPGETIRFRYLVVIHNGETDPAGMAAAYQKYARQK